MAEGAQGALGERMIFRRPGSRRRVRSAAGGAAAAVVAPTQLLEFDNGTFSRTSSATYLTSASTVASVSSNVARPEDIGGAEGAVMLFEGSHTNRILRSEVLSNAAWTATNCTITNNDATAPDGTVTADKITGTTGGAGVTLGQEIATITPTSASQTLWIKRATTTGNGAQIVLNETTTGTIVRTIVSAPLPVAWTRYKLEAPSAFTGTHTIQTFIAPTSDTGGPPLLGTSGDDMHAWGAHVETAISATPAYRATVTVASTTDADTLTFASGAYSASLGDGTKWSFSFYPLGSNAAYGAGPFVLFSFGGTNNEVRLVNDTIVIQSGGATAVTTSALTWSYGQGIEVKLNPAAGLVRITGATTGDGDYTGTPWTWATNVTLRVGGRASSTAEAFCRISEPYSW